MPALYRKYRPQNFSEVVGQNHIKTTLSYEIEAEKVSHAYLFCGPRAVGKTTLARVLAKSVNCLDRKKGSHESCGKCSNCLEISKGNSVDVIEIDAASYTGIDNVRENIINVSRITPTKSKYKVFIIDEVHMLSIQAFNALLKTLEEPPKHVIFILCTTETHKVPSTIISRCQRFDFKKISITDVVNKLSFISQKEKLDIDKKVLEMIARKSGGHMRDAESLFGQIISISNSKKITREDAELIVPNSNFEEAVTLVTYLGNKDIAKAITLVNKLVDDGIILKNFLDNLIEVYRKLMFVKINPSLDNKVGVELGEKIDKDISAISKELDLNHIIRSIETFSEAKLKLKNSFIIQLPIEVAIIKIVNGETKKNIETHMKDFAVKQSVVESDNKNANIEKPIQKKIVSVGDISLEMVNSRWAEVLMHIKKVNHSLVLVIEASKPKEIIGTTLKLSTKYKFHKDRIENISVKALLEKILQTVFGSPLTVEAIVDENMITEKKIAQDDPPVSNISDEELNEDKKEGTSNAMNNLLKTFGGKVVNT